MHSPDTTIPDRATLLERVARIAPLLDASAADGERLRTLCPTAVDALHDAGLFRLWVPAEAGGYDVDLETQVTVMAAVAHADMSACWAMMIGNTVTGVMAARLPDAGFAEVFSSDRMPVAAGSLKPDGRAAPTAGGFLVNGRWGFGSGIHHAGWINANCIAAPDGESPFALALAIPVEQVNVIDDWHVLGLSGSGSSTYEVHDVFVPFARVLSNEIQRGSARTGVPGPRIPIEHASVSLGGARRMLDELGKLAISKRRLTNKQTVADSEAFQQALGQLNDEWSVLYAGVRDSANRVDAAYSHTDVIPPLAAELRAVCALATERCLAIGGRALRFAGAAAIHAEGPLQRVYRDLTASAQHYMISDDAYTQYGKRQLATQVTTNPS